MFLSLTVQNSNGLIVINNFKSNLLQVKSVRLNKLDDEDEIDKVKQLGTDRGRLWLTSLEIIPKHPILGLGIENAEKEYFEGGSNNDKPHNLILGLMVFIGIPGAISLLSCFALVILKNLKKIKLLDDDIFIALMCTICYLCSSMFGNSMFYTQPYFSIFFGFLLSNVLKKYIKE